MEDVATSVRITRDWEDRIFWVEVQSAFEAPESEEIRKERELWERTAADGLALTRRVRRTRGPRMKRGGS